MALSFILLRWRYGTITLALIALGYSFLSYKHLPIWQNDFTLFKYESAKANTSSKSVSNYAVLLAKGGKKIKAHEHFSHAIELFPNNIDARISRAMLEIENENYITSINDLKWVNKNAPLDWRPYELLALIYTIKDKDELAQKVRARSNELKKNLNTAYTPGYEDLEQFVKRYTSLSKTKTSHQTP